MRPTQLMNHLNQDELKKRMKTSADREQFQRWQTIFLTGKGLPLRLLQIMWDARKELSTNGYTIITMQVPRDSSCRVEEEDDSGFLRSMKRALCWNRSGHKPRKEGFSLPMRYGLI